MDGNIINGRREQKKDNSACSEKLTTRLLLTMLLSAILLTLTTPSLTLGCRKLPPGRYDFFRLFLENGVLDTAEMSTIAVAASLDLLPVVKLSDLRRSTASRLPSAGLCLGLRLCVTGIPIS